MEIIFCFRDDHARSTWKVRNVNHIFRAKSLRSDSRSDTQLDLQAKSFIIEKTLNCADDWNYHKKREYKRWSETCVSGLLAGVVEVWNIEGEY